METKKQNFTSTLVNIKFIFFRIRLEIRKFLEKNKLVKEESLGKHRLRKAVVGNYSILVNKFHTIDYNLYKKNFYSRNLPRIASEVVKKYKDSSIIDIGANVGDTVALIRSVGVCNKIICIEGLKYYYDILIKNLVNFNNTFPFNFFLVEKEGTISGNLEVANGTARIFNNKKNVDNIVNVLTLDNFLLKNKITDAKLLKIDTDGYDFKIIRGGLDFIKKNRPIIFFEYDHVYLSELGDDGLSTLRVLLRLGYSKALYYDNYGKFLCSIDLGNESIIQELYNYINNYSGAFRYYDVCVFHQDDYDLACRVINNEKQVDL